MIVFNVFLAIVQAVIALALPPLLISVIWKTKAWFGGRDGPPWLQPYFDLYKLIRKGAVYSRTTTWIFRAGPVVNLATLLTAAVLIPIFSQHALRSFPGDVILVAYLLGLGRMFTVLAALDTGSSFEGMGAAREVTFATMSEPALFLGLTVIAIATHSLQLSNMVGPALLVAWKTAGPALILVLAALLIVLLTECSRIPVDDPATHLELTMIHEVMVLDHSGSDFAYITYGAAMKFMLIGSILLHVAIPQTNWLEETYWFAWLAPFARAAALLLLAGLVGVIESIMARLRLSRVALLLAGATVLGVMAVLLVLPAR